MLVLTSIGLGIKGFIFYQPGNAAERPPYFGPTGGPSSEKYDKFVRILCMAGATKMFGVGRP